MKFMKRNMSKVCPENVEPFNHMLKLIAYYNFIAALCEFIILKNYNLRRF